MLQAYGFIHNAVFSSRKEETKQNFHKKIKGVYQKLLIWLNSTNLEHFSFRKYNFPRFIKNNLFLIMWSALQMKLSQKINVLYEITQATFKVVYEEVVCSELWKRLGIQIFN